MAAGIRTEGIPASFAEDGPARETIVEAAITRACAQYQSQFEKIVLIGDAVWDVRTALRLGLPFVGVAGGEKAVMLRNAGATNVIENFLDYVGCIECFDSAEVPSLRGHMMARPD
jgi:phosphoglycolate phosphatase-like HAD superfamily hydrolase